VEQTTEQTPKTYTEAEFNAKLDEVLGKKIARHDAKIRKEYDRKYGGLEEVLMAGTGKGSVEEITKELEDFFYVKKGIPAPKKAEYTAKEIDILARAEAAEFINAGYDDVVEEVERLTEIGANNMTAREKALFKVLAEHRIGAEASQELSKLGVTEDVYGSKEFKDFQSKFNSNTPIKDIYDIYTKTQPQKQIQTPGSMKNTATDHGKVKEYYSYEEASKFTKADFDKNPDLFRAVEASMQKWK
jgi:hypothetical protein